jgi:hypothetical protein
MAVLGCNGLRCVINIILSLYIQKYIHTHAYTLKMTSACGKAIDLSFVTRQNSVVLYLLLEQLIPVPILGRRNSRPGTRRWGKGVGFCVTRVQTNHL